MKKILVFCILALMAATVYADWQRVDETVYVKVDNTSLYIWSDYFNQTYPLIISTQTSNGAVYYGINTYLATANMFWYANITTTGEIQYSNLTEKMDELYKCSLNTSASVNDFITNKLPYFDRYADCYANLTLCSDYKSQGYKEKSELCLASQGYLQSQLQTTQAQLSTSLLLYNQTMTQNNTLKGQNTFLMIAAVGLAIGLGSCLWKFIYSKRGGSHDIVTNSGNVGVTGFK